MTLSLRVAHLARRRPLARLMGCTAALAATLALPAHRAAAQAIAPTDLLGRVRALGIPSATDQLTVYYNPGYGAKAVRLRTLVQNARQFFADSLGVSPELTLAVLDRASWETVRIQQPYGIPGVDGKPPVAFIPATDDNLAADDALSLASRVSPATRTMLAAAGTTWEEASKRYVDIVGLHELGHTFAAAYGIDVRTPWFGEWVATYFAYSYLKAAQPRETRIWDGILQGYREAVAPAHHTLADFDRLYFGVGAQNYVWYQARFQQQVAAVHAQYGVDFLRRLRVALPRQAAGATPPTATSLMTTLDALAPGFAAWAHRMRP